MTAATLPAAEDPVAALWPQDITDNTAIRARNAIERDGIGTIGELTVLTAAELCDVPHFGPVMLGEVRRVLGLAGHALKGETPAESPGGWALPRGEVPPGPRAPVVNVRLCAACAGFAPAASPGDAGTLPGRCQGCGARSRELHQFPAAVNSAGGCTCAAGCAHVTGDLGPAT